MYSRMYQSSVAITQNDYYEMGKTDKEEGRQSRAEYIKQDRLRNAYIEGYAASCT